MEKVEVCARLRPLNYLEVERKDPEIWTSKGGKEVAIIRDSANGIKKTNQRFFFDNSFGQMATTEEIYSCLVRDLVKTSFEGINSTIFAYGPTGSGKTFTMMGPQFEENPQQQNNEGEGLIFMAMKDLFRKLEIESDKKITVRCSFIEIYNDLVYDLLKDTGNIEDTLTVVERGNEFLIPTATENTITSIDDVVRFIDFGESRRKYAHTLLNHHSSRSHTVFRVIVNCEQQIESDALKKQINHSLMNFVDLAGSEKLSAHADIGVDFSNSKKSQIRKSKALKRIRETKHINKSLFFLTQVINLLGTGNQDCHIPYRNSNLTKILKNSLGGNSRTAVILCIAPCASQYEQTLGTLRFGTNAKKIMNNVTTNTFKNKNYGELKQLLQAYEDKIKILELQKEKDKSHSEELLKMIQKLSSQKVALTDRLIENTQIEHDEISIMSDTRSAQTYGARAETINSGESLSVKNGAAAERIQYLRLQLTKLQEQQAVDKQKIGDYRRRLHKSREAAIHLKSRIKELHQSHEDIEEFALTLLGNGQIEILEDQVINKLAEKLGSTRDRLIQEAERRRMTNTISPFLSSSNEADNLEELVLGKRSAAKSIVEYRPVPSKKIKTALFGITENPFDDKLDVLDDLDLLDPNLHFDMDALADETEGTQFSVDKTVVMDAQELIDQGEILLNRMDNSIYAESNKIVRSEQKWPQTALLKARDQNILPRNLIERFEDTDPKSKADSILDASGGINFSFNKEVQTRSCIKKSPESVELVERTTLSKRLIYID